MLNKSIVILEGLKGPGVVRYHATYDINPLTLRINRGYVVPYQEQKVSFCFGLIKVEGMYIRPTVRILGLFRLALVSSNSDYISNLLSLSSRLL